jgi:hypothetical protein
MFEYITNYTEDEMSNCSPFHRRHWKYILDNYFLAIQMRHVYIEEYSWNNTKAFFLSFTLAIIFQKKTF